MTAVLDASALLAFLHDEPGCERVEAALPHAIISSVNWTEVVQKSIANGADPDGMQDDLTALGLTIAPFSAADAELAGRLWEQTRSIGLSLGDRACLSTAIRLEIPILTADRIWSSLKLSIAIHCIR